MYPEGTLRRGLRLAGELFLDPRLDSKVTHCLTVGEVIYTARSFG